MVADNEVNATFHVYLDQVRFVRPHTVTIYTMYM